MRDAQSSNRDVERLLLRISNEVNEVMDRLLVMPMRHLLLEPIGPYFCFNLNQVVKLLLEPFEHGHIPNLLRLAHLLPYLPYLGFDAVLLCVLFLVNFLHAD